MSLVCEHGSLARSCQVCELTAELAAVKAERGAAQMDVLAYRSRLSLAEEGEAKAARRAELAQGQCAELLAERDGVESMLTQATRRAEEAERALVPPMSASKPRPRAVRARVWCVYPVPREVILDQIDGDLKRLRAGTVVLLLPLGTSSADRRRALAAFEMTTKHAKKEAKKR